MIAHNVLVEVGTAHPPPPAGRKEDGGRCPPCKILIVVIGLLSAGCAEVDHRNDFYRNKDGTYHYYNERGAAEKEIEDYNDTVSTIEGWFK